MDKILFSTIVGLFAAFLTAVFSFTKLINDKEGKISEFRQEWTNSIRKTLSELVSNIKHLIDIYENRAEKIIKCTELNNELGNHQVTSPEHAVIKEGLQFNKNMLESISEEIVSTKKQIQQTLSFALLHFKPSDPDFLNVENKIDNIFTIFGNVDITYSDNPQYIQLRKAEIEVICKDIMAISRTILKREWETIKKGEINYQRTKKFAKYGAFVMFSIISLFLILLVISRYSNYLAEQKIGKIEQNYLPVHSPLCVTADAAKQSDCCSNISINIDNEDNINGSTSAALKNVKSGVVKKKECN